MSISQNFPNTRPSLNLNFARSKTLDPRITFTRTSTATYVDESGFIRDAVADEPRFDHDPVTGECLGLLVEESRQNLLLRSEEFDNEYWNIQNISGSASKGLTNIIAAPDGTVTGDEFISGATNGQYDGLNSNSASVPDDSKTYTASVYVKAGGVTSVRLRLRFIGGTNADGSVFFNLPTSSVTSELSATGTITPAGNDWYRVTATRSNNGTGNTSAQVFVYANQQAGNFYLWGAQVEVGAFPTSYIPTSGGTATRSPDNVTMTGDNFSDWYNSSEWTLMIAARRNYSGNFLTYPNLARINDGTINNNVGFYGALNSTQFTNFGVNSGGINQTPYVAINVPTTSQFKMIQALKENDSTFGGNGTLTTTDTSVLMPVGVNQLHIGGDGKWGGTISQLTYYPVRLTNSTLQTLTK